MLKIVQAFDRAPFAEGDTDDADSLKRKLHAAERVFRDRGSWLKPHQRIAIFRKLAMLGAVIQLQSRYRLWADPASRARSTHSGRWMSLGGSPHSGHFVSQRRATQSCPWIPT